MIPKMLPTKQITAFQKEILDWYKHNKRDLPWRHSRDPYNILVSEVMLQQTQVDRVIPKFFAWMARFPTLASLASASTRDVLLYWSGLGYNRRALYLQRLAQKVVKNNNGIFSQDEKELMQLPGIGQYTARALLCFAFNKQIAVVDTNVRKVILTKFSVVSSQFSDKEMQKIATELLPQGRAYEWNQALMDYASANLKKEKISIPKQAPFKTSKRFYRGQVIRLLLQRSATGKELFDNLENLGISRESFFSILEDMKKDGLIEEKKSRFSLPQ